MKIRVEFLNTDEVIAHIVFEKGWSWDELYAITHEFRGAAMPIPRTVIFDLSNMKFAPKGMIYHCPRILNSLPSGVEKCYVVSYGNMISQIHDIVTALKRDQSGISLEFVDSINKVVGVNV